MNKSKNDEERANEQALALLCFLKNNTHKTPKSQGQIHLKGIVGAVVRDGPVWDDWAFNYGCLFRSSPIGSPKVSMA